MRLTTMTQITVDGVIQGNGHASPEELADGFVRDGWAMGVFAEDTGAMITETYERASAFLFGRRTYEMFHDTWGTRDEMKAHPIGRALAVAPKYVASRTSPAATWEHSSVLSGDLATAVQALKDSGDGELQVHGSGVLVAWLLQHDLIDELTLLTVPIVLGQGQRLFPESGIDVRLEVVRAHVDDRGVMVQVYRPAGRPEYHPARPVGESGRDRA